MTWDKFMPELHWKQPGFTYSDCGPFTKHQEKSQKFWGKDHLIYLYSNELEKACFPYDAAYSDILIVKI